METQNNKFIVPAVILGSAFVLMALIAGMWVYRVRALSNVVSVTGSAQKEVRADMGALTLTVSKTVNKSARASGYAAVAKDVDKTVNFLVGKGLVKENIRIDSPTEYDVYVSENLLAQGKEQQLTVSQQVTVTDANVDLIDSTAKAVTSLSQEGMNIMQYVKYTYEKLREERISLLAEAIKDAQARAEAIAQNSGKSVGSLQGASSGVVQVLAKGSVDISDYGTYDVSTIDKVVMVTTKATFRLK